MQTTLRRRLVLIVVSLTALFIALTLWFVLGATASYIDDQAQLALRESNARQAVALDSAMQSASVPVIGLVRSLENARLARPDLWRVASSALQSVSAMPLALERIAVTRPYRGNSLSTLAFRASGSIGLAPLSVFVQSQTSIINTQSFGGRFALSWSGPEQSLSGSGERILSVRLRFEQAAEAQDSVVRGEISTDQIEALLASLDESRTNRSTPSQQAYTQPATSLLVTSSGQVAAAYLPAGQSFRGRLANSNMLLPAALLARLNRLDNAALLMRDPLDTGDSSQEMYTISTTLPSSGWRLITFTPYNSVLQPLAQRLFGVAFLVVAGLIGLAIAIYLFGKGRISDPMNELTRAAQEIGSGDLRYNISYQDRQDELGGLARALDAMKSNLADSYNSLSLWSHTLERRVEDRTTEVEHARAEAQQLALELRMVYNTSLSLVGTSSLHAVLDQLVRSVPDLLKATYCSIWLLTSDESHLELAASTGETAAIGRTIWRHEGLAGETLLRGEAILLDDYAEFEKRVDWLNSELRRSVSVPLIAVDPNQGGRVIGAMIAGRNITAAPFSDSEQRLLSLLANLISPMVRNGQLFDALDEAVQRAESANAVKTRFLASVTHELRTPLNLIINNADFMRIGTFGDVTDEQSSRLDQSIRSAEHLLYLINDLLDVSKIEAGEMQLFIQSTDPSAIIDDTIESMYGLLDESKPVEFKTDIPKTLQPIEMDARRVRQILTNLLSNAIKFTKQGSVYFSVRIDEPAKTIQFVVQDTGLGIAPEDQARIFEAFERTGRARQEGIEGTGLGLAISRYLATAHNGSLSLTSQVGIGSTFIFTMPLRQPGTLNFLLPLKAEA